MISQINVINWLINIGYIFVIVLVLPSLGSTNNKTTMQALLIFLNNNYNKSPVLMDVW